MDLLNEDYNYLLTSKVQSDSIKRYFSKYRQMSEERFLVSLKEANNSEKKLKLGVPLKKL